MYVAKEDFILRIASGRSVLHLGCVGFTDVAPGDRAKFAKQSLHWKLTQVSETVGVDYSLAVIDEYRNLGVFTNILAGDVERLDELQISTHIRRRNRRRYYRAPFQPGADVGWHQAILYPQHPGHHHHPECVRCAELS